MRLGQSGRESPMNRRKLGRGLSSLLGVDAEVEDAPVHEGAEEAVPMTVADGRTVPVGLIDPNPWQPRREFPADEIAELAESVRRHGVLQPIVLRPVEGRYQLIAGERRLRAAREAGLAEIPARVLDLSDRQTCEIALVENLQRKDLNPVEKAQAFHEYVNRYEATHEELARQLGIDRSTVTNFMRLLELPETVRDAVRHGQISFGHARSLLGVDDKSRQIELCRKIITDGLSVRQTEELVRKLKEGPGEPVAKSAATPKSNHLLALEGRLRQRFGTKVEIRPTDKEKGTILLHFGSNDEFDRLVSLLGDR
jgi:ParB family chromosome partitioning protein